ncbi:MAG: AMP-binding protein, partial [Dechloromonas sp.]|nr:AMP-binding protein [Dechloromonas sp.]
MSDTTLLHELISQATARSDDRNALVHDRSSLAYGELQEQLIRFSSGLMALGTQRGERVAIYLEKRFETVIASFGAPAAGAVFVPLNPLLKPEQVCYIIRDCNVRVLITSRERLALLADTLTQCHDLRHVVVLNSPEPLPTSGPISYSSWSDLLEAPQKPGHRVIDTDVA